MALIDKISALAVSRGKRLVLTPDAFNCEIRDDVDGLGPYITAWSILELGPTPTQADGFTVSELRSTIRTNLPPTPAPTTDEIRDDALLADVDRQAIYNAICSATPQQIKTYIQNNVTDLASARAMLMRLTLLIARVIQR